MKQGGTGGGGNVNASQYGQRATPAPPCGNGGSAKWADLEGVFLVV